MARGSHEYTFSGSGVALGSWRLSRSERKSQALQRFNHIRGMDLLALSIELSSLFSLSESLATLLFGGFDIFLDLRSNRSDFLTSGFRTGRICFAHGFRLPFTDALSHKGGAVSFSHITAIDKEVNHAYISAIVIDLEFSASQSIEQAWAHIPVPLKGKA